MACPECKTGYLKKRSKINEVFWCCSNYPACTYMASKLPNKKTNYKESRYKLAIFKRI